MADNSQSVSRAGDSAIDAASPDAAAKENEGLPALSPLMTRVDVVVAGLIAVVAATITIAMPQLIASGGIDTQRDFSTLPASLVPQLAFGLLTIVALALLVLSWKRAQGGNGRALAGELDGFGRAGVIAVIAIAYAVTMTWLGYILATMLMTVVVSYYLGLRNPLAFIPGALIIPFVVRFVFERLLLISLPGSSIESVGAVEEAVLQYFVRHILH